MGFQRASWEQGIAGQALLEAGERDAAIALARASLIYVNQNGVVAALNGSTTDRSCWEIVSGGRPTGPATPNS